MQASLPATRILVIEDDRAWKALVIRLFQSREPRAECLEADDLASGIRMLGAQDLDLVLLDLNLPDCRGLETLGRVRQENRDVAVVVMTADADEECALQALRNGAQDYIMKDKWDPATFLRAARYAREKMASELRLRRSEDLFLAISENIVDLLAIVDSEGRRVFTSPSYARLLGYSLEEIAAIHLEDLVHSEDLAAVKGALDSIFSRGTASSLEYRLRHRDGHYLVVESRASRFASVEGAGYQALVVARDVTERRRAEVERVEQEIHRRQAQKMEAVGQLASGIAHEINTPIQYVNLNLVFLKKTYAKLMNLVRLYQAARPDLEAGPSARLSEAEDEMDLPFLEKELPKVLQDSLDGVQRVAKIIRAMKEFSHPGSRERTLVDVNRLVGSTATISRNEWKYVADLELDLEDGLPMVPGFAAELGQVFLNLIVNAAQAIAAKGQDEGKGRIVVSTRGRGEDVEIRVTDSGIGIQPDHLPRIFEPFFTTKDVGQGTGQGLTICYQTVVQMHGGRIFAEAAPPAGTTFTVQLPTTLQPSLTGLKG